MFYTGMAVRYMEVVHSLPLFLSSTISLGGYELYVQYSEFGRDFDFAYYL